LGGQSRSALRLLAFAFGIAAVVALAACSGGGGGTNASKTQQVRAGLSDLTSYRCALTIQGSGSALADLEAALSPQAPGTPPAVGPTATAAQTVGFEATVVYVKPDKAQLSIKIGDQAYGQTTIGKQQWSSLGSLTVGPNAVPAQTPSDLSLCAAFWDGGFADSAADFQCSGKPQNVNGQESLKCAIDSATFDQIKQALGGIVSDAESGIRELSRFQMELWVTDGSGNVPGGLPVRFQADMAGKDSANKDFAMKINMDLTRINDKGLKVEPPK
jgi:hypothetical protein